MEETWQSSKKAWDSPWDMEADHYSGILLQRQQDTLSLAASPTITPKVMLARLKVAEEKYRKVIEHDARLQEKGVDIIYFPRGEGGSFVELRQSLDDYRSFYDLVRESGKDPKEIFERVTPPYNLEEFAKQLEELTKKVTEGSRIVLNQMIDFALVLKTNYCSLHPPE